MGFSYGRNPTHLVTKTGLYNLSGNGDLNLMWDGDLNGNGNSTNSPSEAFRGVSDPEYLIFLSSYHLIIGLGDPPRPNYHPLSKLLRFSESVFNQNFDSIFESILTSKRHPQITQNHKKH